MMKATWKPHTKKPAVSSQKLGCRKASRQRLPQGLVCARPLGAPGLPPIGQASGISSAVIAISHTQALLPADELDQQMHHRQRHEAADAGRHADRGDGATAASRAAPAGRSCRPATVTPVPLTPMPISTPLISRSVGGGGRVHEIEPGDGGQHADRRRSAQRRTCRSGRRKAARRRPSCSCASAIARPNGSRPMSSALVTGGR